MRVPYVAWQRNNNRLINIQVRGCPVIGFGQNVITPSLARGYVVGFKINGDFIDVFVRVKNEVRLVWAEYLQPIASDSLPKGL